MADGLTKETFSRHLGKRFRIQVEPGREVEMELTEATTLGAGEGPKNRPESFRPEPFSIVFRGPKDSLLPQRIYRVSHPEMGEHDIFLVPIGADEEGLRYEAVFN